MDVKQSRQSIGRWPPLQRESQTYTNAYRVDPPRFLVGGCSQHKDEKIVTRMDCRFVRDGRSYPAKVECG